MWTTETNKNKNVIEMFTVFNITQVENNSYLNKTNAMLDAKVSMTPVFQALSFSYKWNRLWVKCWSSLATPNEANNFKMVPEWVKYIDTNGPSSDL